MIPKKLRSRLGAGGGGGAEVEGPAAVGLPGSGLAVVVVVVVGTPPADEVAFSTLSSAAAVAFCTFSAT